MSTTYLKVKVKSLAAEARIIRREEAKFKRMTRYAEGLEPDTDDALRLAAEAATSRATWEELSQHRRFDVRNEARSALIAYGYLRDKAYHEMEASFYAPPNWNRVAEIIIKFGGFNDNTFNIALVTKAEKMEAVLLGLKAWSGKVRIDNKGKYLVLRTGANAGGVLVDSVVTA